MGMGGIQRVFNIPEKLNEIGWDVTVYTTEFPRGYPRDDSLEERINVKVVRTFCPDLLHLLSGGMYRAGRGRRDYVSFPDNKLPWILPLLKNLRKSDACITTHPPFSLLLTGHFLESTPWIIDYREPWTGSFLGKYFFQFEENLAESIERYSIEKASAVVTVKRSHLDYLREKYHSFRDKFHLVRNGYSEEHFPPDGGRELGDTITLTYMGTFNERLRPEILFDGLKELLNKEEELKCKLVFKHIGYSGVDNLENLVRESGINKIKLKGYLPHEEAMKELLSSDILILIGAGGGEDKRIIPGKLYEYLRAKRPVVAVTENAEIADIIGGQGITCGFSPEEIAESISRIIESYGEFNSRENYRKYSWENLAKKYSEILKSVI